MTSLIVAQRNDNNNVQASSDLSYGNVAMDQYGSLNVNVKNNEPSVYVAQSDSYSAEVSNVQLISAVRNDSSANTLCDTNNSICPLSCDASGALFCYVKGQSSGNVSQISGNSVAVSSGNLSSGVQRIAIATDDVNLSNINSKINTMQSDLSTIKGDSSTMRSDISTMRSDIASMKSDISSMKSNFDSLMTIMNDVYISSTHRIRTLAQAL